MNSSKLKLQFVHHSRIDSFLEDIPTTPTMPPGTSGLKPYWQSSTSSDIYSAKEALSLSNQGVESRMRVKISDHYESLITGQFGMPPSKPLRRLVTARLEEVTNMDGEADPSCQLSFSPVAGLLHKYEMVLIHVAKTCSAHCRYCYRLDFFSGKTGKKVAKISDVVSYIQTYNNKITQSKGNNFVREVLLSGGDPMVLSNKVLANWICKLAEINIHQIRIGTKEIAFQPNRFDDHFFQMLDRFHSFYPDVRLVFAVHFSHPDEFLERDDNGDYKQSLAGIYQWLKSVEEPIVKLTRRRHYISLENQTPIIKDVNDSPEVLECLQRQLYNKGIGNHYFFQCRNIEGHRAFAVPIERSLKILHQSQKSLSGVEMKAPLVMSTQRGKVEVVGMNDTQIIFRLLRDSQGGQARGGLAIARRNPDAIWINDYNDRIINDMHKLIQ